MARFAEEIAKLSDPAPKLLDPEDDINVESSARISERFIEDSVVPSEISNLRQKTAPLLEDVDARYIGKRISRKSLDETYDSDSSETEDSERDVGNEDISNFIKQIRESTDVQSSDKEDLNASGLSEADSVSEESDDSDEGEKDDAEVDNEEDQEEDMFKKFSHIDVNEEIEKGKAVEAQIGLWNKLCECRIRFQKILTAANQIPQFDTWNDFKKKGNKNYLNALKKGPVCLKSLLCSMLELQSQLLLSSHETKNFATTPDKPPVQENEEEISSGSESESNEADVKSEIIASEGETKKRKPRLDECDNIIAKRFKAFVPYRNSVIQKWDEKTHLTGKMTQKSFSAFNQSALKQIDQVLQDKQRLIRRTQLKRSQYSVLGKKEEKETRMEKKEENEKNETEEHVKRDEHLNCYDPEIFDDDDFYSLLLKDVIESKAVGMDPDILRTHMEIQKNRRKMKKKVDTKASKGRKIRYDPHPKMVSFMAGVYSPHLYADETKDDLFKRMFNQQPAIIT